ncbi:MAG TPA: MFS transporter [Rhabdochlamydiaceae bacterium]|nr:MFS transporter [Rhabdochlamydiaceae bacterium]
MTLGLPLRTFFLLLLSHVFVDFFLGIWPLYKTMAQLDIAEAGFIAGLSGFIGEILQLGFGYFCDRGHRKRILVFGIVMVSSIAWITLVTHSYLIFLLMLLLMVGSGSFHPAAVGALASISSPFKGRLILLFTACGAIGMAVSQVVFTNLVNSTGHALWLLIPLLLLAFVVLTHSFPSMTMQNQMNFRNFFVQIAEHKKPLLLLYFSQISSYAVNLTFVFMLPDILRMKNCHPWLQFGGGHMSFVSGSILSMFVFGLVGHKWGYKRLLILSNICACLFLLIFLFFPVQSPLFVSALLILIGGFLCLINPMVVSWGNQIVPHSPSTISALLMGFAWCFSNLGPVIAGCLAKTTAHIISMAAISILLLISLVLFFLIPQKQPEKAADIIQE